MRPARVTNADRDWAIAQMPSWCQRGDLIDGTSEVVNDGAWLDQEPQITVEFEKPNWSAFVAEEIENFERHYAGEYRSLDEWSSIWRKGWWPKVSARKRFPKSAPHEPQPFFRAGTPEFDLALKAATPEEKRMWTRFKIAQFKPDDPRLKHVQNGEPLPGKSLSQKSKRIIGDAA
jgi:hypothetical protein